MSAEIDAVKTAFPGVNEVAFSDKDFGETLLASRSQYYRFACIDGENVLLAVTADGSEYTALDEILVSPLERIMELGGLNPDTAVSEAERGGVLSTLREAVTRYESEAETLAAAYYATAEYTRIMALTDIIAVPEAVKNLFPNAVALAVGVFTDSMEYTADGNVQGETCKMAYVSAIKADGSAVVYSVTVGEGTGDIVSGNIDVAQTGEYAFGITLDSLPALSQPVLTVLFDDLYAEVFGADYDLVPFETFFNDLTAEVFKNAQTFEILFYTLNKNSFSLYANFVYGEGRVAFVGANYKGASLPVILDYSSLSEEMEGSASLKDYLQSTFSTNGKLSANDVERVITELNTYKTRTAAIDRMKKFTNFNSFSWPGGSITNTTADINFDDYAAEYTPAGATPLICYVGALKGRIIDDNGQGGRYFNTGYVNRFDAVVVFIDQTGNLVCKKDTIAVPEYTNSTDNSLYASGLGELNKDYVVFNKEITIIEDPIISEWLLPSA